MKNASIRSLAGMLVMAAASYAMAVSPPVYEGFETNAAGTVLTGMTAQGWSASAPDVVVVSSNGIGRAVAGGTNAVAMPATTMVSNLVASASPTVIWVDFQKNQVLDQIHVTDPNALALDSNTTVQVCLNTNRSVWLYDKAIPGWTNLVTDFRGTNISVFSTGSWSRITLYENFTNHQASIFLDGHLLRDQVQFVSNRSTFAGFLLENGADGTNYLDEVYVYTNVPPGLAADLDADGVADAQELQTYGNISTWRRWTNTVTSTGSGSVIPAAGISTVSNGTTITYAFQAAAGYGIGSVTTNGGAYPYAGDAKTGMCSWVITADGTFTVAFTPKSAWAVPSDLATLAGAVAYAVAGDTIIASNGLVSAGDVTLDKALTLAGTNVTVSGTLTVNQGVSVTMSAATNWTFTTASVGTNAALVLSNASLSLASLAISSGGVVRVVNGTVMANGAILSGNFTLDWTWGRLTPAPLNFLDKFENYGVGTQVGALGAFGWGASSTGVVVQGTTKYAGSLAMQAPAGATVSNAIASVAGQTNVWTDLWVNESSHVSEFQAEALDTNVSVQVCITTGRLLAVYHDEAWDVCSNDFNRSSVTGLYTTGWARITVNQNYGTRRSAIFLNGHLLRENVPFVNQSLALCAGLKLTGGAESDAYVDSVSLATNYPADLDTDGYDADHDGVPDVREINLYGTLFAWPRGAVFKIR